MAGISSITVLVDGSWIITPLQRPEKKHLRTCGRPVRLLLRSFAAEGLTGGERKGKDMKRIKQYLIQIESGPLKGETAWAVRSGDKFIRGSRTGFIISHRKEDVTVLDTRWYEDRTD